MEKLTSAGLLPSAIMKNVLTFIHSSSSTVWPITRTIVMVSTTCLCIGFCYCNYCCYYYHYLHHLRHSFIHSFKVLCSTSSRKLLRGAPDSSTAQKSFQLTIDCVRKYPRSEA